VSNKKKRDEDQPLPENNSEKDATLEDGTESDPKSETENKDAVEVDGAAAAEDDSDLEAVLAGIEEEGADEAPAGDNGDGEELVLPDELPLLPVRDVVVFPFMIMPLFVGREASIKAVEEALSGDRLIFLVTQKDLREENPDRGGVYRVGTISMIMRMLKLPDGRVKILVQGLAKAAITEVVQRKPLFRVRVEKLEDIEKDKLDLKTEATMRSVKERLEKAISLGKPVAPEVAMILDNINLPGRLADLVLLDTQAHVQHFHQDFGTSLDKLRQVPVGADEVYCRGPSSSGGESDSFRVLYFGQYIPLHGVNYIVQAAKALTVSIVSWGWKRIPPFVGPRASLY